MRGTAGTFRVTTGKARKSTKEVEGRIMTETPITRGHGAHLHLTFDLGEKRIRVHVAGKELQEIREHLAGRTKMLFEAEEAVRQAAQAKRAGEEAPAFYWTGKAFGLIQAARLVTAAGYDRMGGTMEDRETVDRMIAEKLEELEADARTLRALTRNPPKREG